ncbi:hypothetical protein NP493_1127g02051 [Ridgeia piscesae]|uniref:Uncharacterized protein n=1 Tax=Ridgeia piscesae TaxID=27915 RepID=A0AAD9NHV9_RIDPI|nr:hypothetical protein NP493_1127g02051 [Ridgeia piscesae]
MLTPARNHRQLRSSSNPFYIPRVKTTAGTRPFSVAAPTVWNSLPASVKLERNIVSFLRRLKTYLLTIRVLLTITRAHNDLLVLSRQCA